MLRQHGHRCIGVERHAPGHHLIEYYPGGIQIGARVDRLSKRLLWRHIGRCADDQARHRQALPIVHKLGDAEIGQHRPVRRRHQHVGGFDVAMDHTTRMGIIQRSQQAPYQPQRLSRRHGRPKPVAECGAPFDIVRREVEQAILLAIVIDRQNVMVLQLGDRAGLTLETRLELRIGVIVHDLDGDKAIQRGLVGFVDRGHAAATDDLDQMILAQAFIAQVIVHHHGPLG
jgi:hypothetical protein